MAGGRDAIRRQRRVDAHRSHPDPSLADPSGDLWVNAALCAAVTHNDPGSISACAASTLPFSCETPGLLRVGSRPYWSQNA
jgi:hypothetical protein